MCVRMRAPRLAHCHRFWPVFYSDKQCECRKMFKSFFFILSREQGELAAQPGVGPPGGYDDDEIEMKWRFHNYYQWVVFFLCFMVSIFQFLKDNSVGYLSLVSLLVVMRMSHNAFHCT